MGENMTNDERWDIEAQITTIEEEILPGYKKSLAALTSPDYDPAQNADNDLREQDIDFFENEIAEAEEELKNLKQRLTMA
jgi:hypothetical protein